MSHPEASTDAEPHTHPDRGGTDHADTAAGKGPDPTSERVEPAGQPRFHGLRAELLLALEIAGLCGLAFTRPVLDSYGQSPEAFLARDAVWTDILLFGLIVAVVPTLLIAGLAALTNLGGRRVRHIAQIVLVALLGGVAAWRYGTDLTGFGRRALVPLAAVTALGLGALRWRVEPSVRFLRFLGAASVLFLVLFLVASPSSDLIFRGSSAAGASEEYTAAVLDQTDGDPPPIVLVVLDALPTGMLLDGEGDIDASLYPNLAELAGDSTWYRNYTTMHAWTFQAVPLMFTGQIPSGEQLPDAHNFPDNIYTLFAGTHDIEAVEQLSRLCPTSVCPRTSDSALPHLLDDAVTWWRDGTDPNREVGQILPGALDDDRDDEFTAWIDEQDFSTDGERPGFWSYHVVLPHEPWYLLPDGEQYRVHDEHEYGLVLHNVWQDTGPDVGRQRQLLQALAVDNMLGNLLDDLRASGIYDDALVAVVGDHGQAFTPQEPIRGVSEAQYDQVMWSPLMVKAPGQTEGAIDDTNLQSVDVTPLLADTIGIELPFEVDGLTPDQVAAERGPDTKQLIDGDHHVLEPGDDGFITVDATTGLERVLESRAVDNPGGGEAAAWERSEHGDLLGAPVGDLDVAEGSAGTLEVEYLADMEEQRDSDTLLLELIAHSDVEVDSVVAVAVDDRIATVAPTTVPIAGSFADGGTVLEGPDSDSSVHAILHPDAFRSSSEGAPHTLSAYLVTGSPDSPTLTPLTLLPA